MNFIESLQDKIKLYNELIPKKFSSNPPIKNEEITSFENNYEVIIPKDYKEFLLNIGNGEFELNNDYFLELTASTWGNISKPFNPNIENENFNGLLQIVELNHSGGIIFLVVNGSEYGNIWYSDSNSDIDIQPFLDKENKVMNFDGLINYYFDSEMRYYIKAQERAKSNALVLKKKNQAVKKNNSEEKSLMKLLLKIFK